MAGDDHDDAIVQVTICREYDFDAAHHLEWHPGQCRNLHGHTYRLEVAVTGDVDARGVVMDFAELDAAVKDRVLAALDHRLLNEVVDNPTAERVGRWIWNALSAAGLHLAEVRLWETRRSSVRIRAADPLAPR